MTAVRAPILTAVGSALVDAAMGNVEFCDGWYVGCCACVGVIPNVASQARPPIAKFAALYMSSTSYGSSGLCVGNQSCSRCMMRCASSGRKPQIKFRDCSAADIRFLLMRYRVMSRNCRK